MPLPRGAGGGRQPHADSNSEERVLTNTWSWHISTIWQDCSELGETEAQGYKGSEKRWGGGGWTQRRQSLFKMMHTIHTMYSLRSQIRFLQSSFHDTKCVHIQLSHQLYTTEKNDFDSVKCTLASGKESCCVVEFRGVRALGGHWQPPTSTPDFGTAQCPRLLPRHTCSPWVPTTALVKANS